MDTNPDKAKSLLEPENGIAEGKKSRTISVKTGVIVAVVLIAGALAYGYKSLLIAATVNGSYISRLSVIRELEKESGKRVLDVLVTRKLIDEEARKKGISVGSDEIDEEIKKVDEQIKAQGQDLNQALEAQGVTFEDFKEQITIRKTMEKLLADKVQVTDEEVTQYIKDNKLTAPVGGEANFTADVKKQLEQQKLNSEAMSFIESLRAQASIKYYAKY